MSLKGLKIVLTGKFSGQSRSDAKAALKKAGASVGSSVTAKTDLLIAGAKAGSKIYDARDKGVPILADAHLQMLLNGDEVDEVVALARTFYSIGKTSEDPGDGSCMFSGGVPQVGADRWPMWGDEPMRHMLTLDLAAMPALEVYYPGHRALSLFMVRNDELDMYALSNPNNGCFELLASTEDELATAGDPPMGAADAAWGKRWITLETHGWDDLDGAFGGERVLGGVPCWCQSQQHQGRFLMQLGEGWGPSGDGLLYVFDDSVFAQFT